MKSRIPYAVAAVLLAAAVPLAHSQVPPANFVAEPVASVSRPDPVASAVAQALSAEPALKQSKITVQPVEDGNILLTGSASTEAQRLQAGKIAAQAGGGTVINTINVDEMVIWVPPPKDDAALAEEAPATDEAPAAEPAPAAAEQPTRS
jgi:hypothetical protein